MNEKRMKNQWKMNKEWIKKLIKKLIKNKWKMNEDAWKTNEWIA